MRLRLHRKSLLEDSKEYDDAGDQERARHYHHLVSNPDYNSDYFMFDDE